MTGRAQIETLLRYLVSSLVEHPEAIAIACKESGATVTYEISLHPDDVGKVIGRQGRIIKAIRTVVRAAGSVHGDSVGVDILG